MKAKKIIAKKSKLKTKEK